LDSGETHRIVKIWNPWGSEQEPEDEWGDSGANWRRVSESDKKRIGHSVIPDGQWFMSFSEFKTSFKKTIICLADDLSTTTTIPLTQKSIGNVTKFTIDEDENIVVSLHQKHKWEVSWRYNYKTPECAFVLYNSELEEV
jgi:hypothetical protein